MTPKPIRQYALPGPNDYTRTIKDPRTGCTLEFRSLAEAKKVAAETGFTVELCRDSPRFAVRDPRPFFTDWSKYDA